MIGSDILSPITVEWLLELYIIPTPKSYKDGYPLAWRLYRGAPLVDQAADSMIQYPTQSKCPGTEQTSSCPMLTMLTIWHGSYKCRSVIYKIDLTRVQICGFETKTGVISSTDPVAVKGSNNEWQSMTYQLMS